MGGGGDDANVVDEAEGLHAGILNCRLSEGKWKKISAKVTAIFKRSRVERS